MTPEKHARIASQGRGPFPDARSSVKVQRCEGPGQAHRAGRPSRSSRARRERHLLPPADRGQPRDRRRQAFHPGRVGLGLPRRSLRRLHDGHQRQGAPVLLVPDRRVRANEGDDDHPRAHEQVPGRPRPLGRPLAPLPQPQARQGVGARSTAPTRSAPAPPSPRESRRRGTSSPTCMSCGCCLEACPQFTLEEEPRSTGTPRSSAPTPSARPASSTSTRRASRSRASASTRSWARAASTTAATPRTA
jgi:hypothetical protein